MPRGYFLIASYLVIKKIHLLEAFELSVTASDVGVWGAEERQKQLSVCSNRYQRDHAGDAIRLWQRLPAPRTNTAPAC